MFETCNLCHREPCVCGLQVPSKAATAEFYQNIAAQATAELAKGANSKQVGGDHYNKEGEQHWDRIYRLYGRGYFIGCATKYAERYHLKNGKQDLEKAIHFLQKLIELEYPDTPADGGPTSDYVNQDR